MYRSYNRLTPYFGVKMELVDRIIIVKSAITLDDYNRVIDKAAIAINNGVIVDVDAKDRVLSRFKGEEVVEKPKHIAIPGLVDCHTHTQQFLLRSFIDDLLVQQPPIWTKILVPFEEAMDVEYARLSTQASLINMLKNGITYYIEAGAPYPDVLVEETLRVRLKGIVTYATYNVVDGVETEDTSRVVRKVEELINMVRGGSVKVWVSLRQLMMVNDELLDKILKLVVKHKTGFTIHLGEYQGEVDYCILKHGFRPLEFILSRLKGVKPIVISHGLFLSIKELNLARENGVTVCWCPTVDSWLSGIHWAGLIDYPYLTIGSDGGAWGRLDLLHEVKVARALSRSLTNSILYYKTGVDSIKLLKMITGLGGETLGEKIGAIKRGYSADIVLIDVSKLKNIPVVNPINTVVDFVEGDSITDVIIDGKTVVEDSEVLTIDEKRVQEKILNIEDEVKTKLYEITRNIFKEHKYTEYPP